MKIRNSICVVLCTVCPIIASPQTPIDSVKPAVEIIQTFKKADSSIFNLNVFGRTSLNVGKNKDRHLNAGFKLDETRLLFSGKLTPDLSYKVRFKLNKSFGTTSQDNGSKALDYALVKYRFGKQKEWEVTLGKQAAAVGSYEFFNNAVYEYAYTDHVGGILNLFVVGVNFSYEVNPDHKFHLQIYNTSTETFDQLIKNAVYSVGDLKESKRPLGAYLTWEASFLNKAFHTKWSYNYSQLVVNGDNHAISLGNMYQSKNTKVYLDLQSSNYGVDHTMLASNPIYAFKGNTGADRKMLRNIVYKTAVLRYDQQFNKSWSISLKGAFETATASKDKEIGNNFRTNWIGVAALEYKPILDKDWKFFVGYVDNTISYKNRIGLPTEKNNRFVLGTYFNLSMI